MERAVAVRTVLAGRRAPVALRLGVVARFAGFRRDLASDLPALFALALVCLLGGRVEELTPELPDLAHLPRQGPSPFHRRPGRRGGATRPVEMPAATFDRPAKVAEPRPPAPARASPGEHAAPAPPRRFPLGPMGRGPAVRAGNVDLLRQCVSHVAPSKFARRDAGPHLPTPIEHSCCGPDQKVGSICPSGGTGTPRPLPAPTPPPPPPATPPAASSFAPPPPP